MNKMKFGSYIKESRIKRNYTQQELADLLFVDVSTVSKWERGVSYPDITLVPDICRVLEISEHELIHSSRDVEYRKMEKDATKFNNMKKGTFWMLNISYLVAIIVCFIVNVAVNNTLSWFFIVLTSIMCAYSFCPTITWLFTKYKKLAFIGSTFISMFLLFFTCSAYSNNYWFMIATLGLLLGYFIAFYPLLFKQQKRYLTEEKYNIFSKWFLLSYVVGMLIIASLLLVSIYFYVRFNLGVGLLIMGGCFVIPLTFGVLNLFEVSKTINKPLLLLIVGIFVLLLVAGLGRSIYLKNTEVTKTYIIEEEYNEIKIEGKNLDVNVYLSTNNENKVVYMENKKLLVETKVIDGVLMINQGDNRKFYDMLFNFSHLEVNLYLTEKLINMLDIEDGIGDIDVYKGFTFNNVDISNSTGDIEFKANVTNNLNIKNLTGDVEIENSSIGGNVSISTSTGDIEIGNVNCNKLDINIGTGDTELVNTLVSTDFNMSGSTGNVHLDGFDAGDIYIKVSTGDVEGTIVSSKIFIARSKTGSVSVPETLTGGVCKIEASTGNIKIIYK